MRIDRVETILLDCPWGETGTRRWPVVRICTDTGHCGISRGGNPELIERLFAPLLLGEDPRDRVRLWEAMYEAAWALRGPGRTAMGSIGALDIALWDLYGQACGEPVWRLLGGYRNRVPVYADGIGFGVHSPEEVAGLVRKHAGLGFGAVKFHLSDPDPDVALEKVRLSREALGDEKKLMIDIRRMWSGRQAVAEVRKYAPYDLYWIEEPVRLDDEPGNLRMVREATDALLAGGESEPTIYGVRRLIVEGGLQVVQTDIILGGGFTGIMRLAALAEAHHVYIAPHGASFPELNCHVLAAAPNGLMVPACPHTEPYQIWSQLYDPPFEVVAGEIALSDRPGLGLGLNEAFVEAHRVQPGR